MKAQFNLPGERICVSFFKSLLDKSSEEITLDEIIERIRTGDRYLNIIEKLRDANNIQNKEALKKKLPAITPSGCFGEQRKLDYLKSYSQIICLDFDKLIDLESMKAKIRKDRFCMAAMVSPSGNGLKIMVKVKGTINDHSNNYESLSNYFFEKYNISADRSCKDITRLMFLTYDPDLYNNKSSEIWSLNSHYLDIFNECINELNTKEEFREGNRNQYVFDLAKRCRDKKLEIDFVLKEIVARFCIGDFTRKEIAASVKSAYTWAPSPLKRDDIKGYSTWDRVEEYLNDNFDLRLNIISTKIEFKRKDSVEKFEELNENSIYRELKKKNINISHSDLGSLLYSDYVKKYNPFDDYFRSLGAWNREIDEDYILKLCDFISVKDTERFKKHFKKMLVRCIACALQDDYFNKQVFVLVHDQQNSGKSTFCRWLCPPALEAYITENINTDKDSLITLATNFIINMDELATLNKTELNALKSFISKDKINVRLPYERKAVLLPRRANFIASTNKDEFLTDETGSVRWLCFELKDKIDFTYKEKIDIDNIWRQAYTLYNDNFQYQLTPEEIIENEAANRKFQITGAEYDLIPRYYSPGDDCQTSIFLTATEILSAISKLHPELKVSPINIGKALAYLGYKKSHHYNENAKYSVKGYFVNKLF